MIKFKFLIILWFIYLSAFSQEKKEKPTNNPYKFNIGANIGFCKYQIKYNDTYLLPMFSTINDAGDNVKLYVDYSIFKRLAMGFSFEHNGFINQHNSSSDTVESFNTVSSSNICISVKFKFLNKNQNNLYLEILPVYSWLAIKNQSHFPYEITSNGFGFQTALGWNHFFNKHFGFNLHSSYTAIKYKSNINNSDPFMANLYYNPQTINLEYTGFVSSLGLLVRF